MNLRLETPPAEVGFRAGLLGAVVGTGLVGPCAEREHELGCGCLVPALWSCVAFRELMTISLRGP